MVNITIQQLNISVVLSVDRYLEGSASTSFVIPACMGLPIKNYSRNIVNDPLRLTAPRSKMPTDPTLRFTNV